MKLASQKGGRDGRLVVVSADLAWYAPADRIALTLQDALDDWERCEPELRGLAESLEHGSAPRARFHEHDAESPLPRAYQWADGSVYGDHVALLLGDAAPKAGGDGPLMRQGGSDSFRAPRDPIELADSAWGCDLEGEVAVIVGDVPMGASREEALNAVRLVMLCNDVSLRSLAGPELAKGMGLLNAKPPPAFSPVAVTPDALPGWRDGKLHGRLEVELNGRLIGEPDAGADMAFDFGGLIAHLARTRRLGAGTIVGAGAVSNHAAGGAPGLPIGEGGAGYACLAEMRAVEALRKGAAATPFLKPGDVVRIQMADERRHSIFGAIEQTVVGPGG